MEPFSIHLGSFVIDVNPKRLIAIPRSRDGRHFTLFFNPKKGRSAPHITLPKATKPYIPLGSWSEGAGRKLDKALSDAWGKVWLAALRPADLESLHAEGWVAIRPTEERLLRWIDQRLKVGPHTYKIDEKVLRHLWELAVDGETSVLDLKPGECRAPVSILPCGGPEIGEGRLLAFLQEGPWGEAGWYWWPLRLLSSEDALKPLFAHCGPRLAKALRTMNRWLRLNWKEDALADFDRWASPPGA
jgi:hypothetical protein